MTVVLTSASKLKLRKARAIATIHINHAFGNSLSKCARQIQATTAISTYHRIDVFHTLVITLPINSMQGHPRRAPKMLKRRKAHAKITQVKFTHAIATMHATKYSDESPIQVTHTKRHRDLLDITPRQVSNPNGRESARPTRGACPARWTGTPSCRGAVKAGLNQIGYKIVRFGRQELF